MDKNIESNESVVNAEGSLYIPFGNMIGGIVTIGLLVVALFVIEPSMLNSELPGSGVFAHFDKFAYAAIFLIYVSVLMKCASADDYNKKQVEEGKLESSGYRSTSLCF